jgi:hypothetical protein
MATNQTSIILTADDRTRAAFTSAKNSLQGLQAAGSKLNSILGTLGVGAIAGGGLLAFAKSSIDAADNLNDLSQKIGVSVETLAGYKLAAEQSGTSLEGMGNAARFLNKNIAEQDPLLKKLGISATDANGALVQLADVFAAMPDGAQKTAIAMQLMGKSGADMIPLLNGGSAALQEMLDQGKKLYPVTAEMARAADQFNDSLAVFKVQAEGAGISIANALLPAMNDMLARWNDAITLSNQHGGFIGLIMGGINPTGDNATNLANVRKEMAAIQLQLKDAGTVEGAIGGIDAKRLQARLADLEKLKTSLLEIQRTQALALGAPFADYKTAKTPRKDAAKDRFGTSGKAKTDKLDTIDPFGAQRRAAEAAELSAQIAAQNAAFDALAESRDYQIAQDEKAAGELGRLRAEYVAILDPIQQYRDKLDEVDKLAESGLLNADQATAARLYWQEQIDAAAGFGEAMKQTATEMDLFWQEAAKGMQASLSDFLFDPFENGVDGMLKSFGTMLQRMAADAIAADISRAIFDNASSAGGGGQNILGSVAELFGFANGGAFTVGGGGGTDSQLVAFKATPGEEVSIRTPAQQRTSGGGNITVNFQVTSPDAESFRKSTGQIQADLARAMQGARRYS